MRGERFHLLEELESSHFNMKMTDISVGLFRYAHFLLLLIRWSSPSISPGESLKRKLMWSR
ncbi:hypothetical protein [Paenibacillus sp. NPDC055715]